MVIKHLINKQVYRFNIATLIGLNLVALGVFASTLITLSRDHSESQSYFLDLKASNRSTKNLIAINGVSGRNELKVAGTAVVKTLANRAKTANASITAPPIDPFRQAVNAAMSAAKLAQLSKVQAEWNLVVYQWQQAIAYMKAVPSSNANWSLAQRKVVEYEQNLAYAKQKTEGSKQPRVFTNIEAAASRNARLVNIPATTTGQLKHTSASSGLVLANSNASASSSLVLANNDASATSSPVLTNEADLIPRNWSRIATTANQEVFYLDLESVNRNLPYVEFWQRIYSIDRKGSVLLRDQRLLANCQTNQFRVKETTYSASEPTQERLGSSSRASSDFAQASVLTSVCGQPWKSNINRYTSKN